MTAEWQNADKSFGRDDENERQVMKYLLSISKCTVAPMYFTLSPGSQTEKKREDWLRIHPVWEQE